MDLTELMKQYNPVYPDTRQWPDTFKVFMDDANDQAIIVDLVTDLENYGQFREPVILSTYAEDSDNGEYEPFVKNGTHRVYAHYLAGINEVNVHHGWVVVEDESVAARDDFEMSLTLIKFSEKLDDELLWDISDTVRSFKLTNEIWFESSSMSFEGDQYMTLIWSDMDTPLSMKDIDLVETALRTKVAALGVVIDAIATRHVMNEDEYDIFDKCFKKTY